MRALITYSELTIAAFKNTDFVRMNYRIPMFNFTNPIYLRKLKRHQVGIPAVMLIRLTPYQLTSDQSQHFLLSVCFTEYLERVPGH